MKLRNTTPATWSDKTVWIVGASSGIGAATARELTSRGAHVAISARRAEALNEVAGTDMLSVPLDTTDRDAVRAAWTRITTELGAPDVVIHAAGLWKQTPKGTFSADDFTAHVKVNLDGLANVLDTVVPHFVERGAGTIVGIASVAGYRGLPGGEYYGATKAAQVNLLEALRGSLRPRGVNVVTVCPGFVDTEMTQGNSFPMPFTVTAERAASEIVDGLEHGRQEIVFPNRMTAVMKTARFVPVRAWTQLVAR